MTGRKYIPQKKAKKTKKTKQQQQQQQQQQQNHTTCNIQRESDNDILSKLMPLIFTEF